MCTSIEGVCMCVYVRQTYRLDLWSSFTSPYAKITFLLSKAKQKSILMVTGCFLCLCVLLGISQTAGKKWFLFTVKLVIGQGNIYDYFKKGYLNPSKRIRKRLPQPIKTFFLFF